MNSTSMTRCFAIGFGAWCCVALFIGCGRSPNRATAGRPLSPDNLFVFIGPAETEANSAGICGGARRYAAQYPNVHLLQIVPRDGGAEALAAAVDEAIVQKPDAICMYARSAPDEQVFERIRRNSIVLVTIGPPLKNPAIYGQVDVALPQAAELLAQNLTSLLPPAVNSFGHERLQRSYALFHADGRDQSASDTYARFAASLPEQLDLVRLEQKNLWASDRTPQQLIAETLDRFSTVELIVTLDPEPWLSEQPRFRLPARNHFATLGASPRLWPRLQSGEALALVGALEGDIGYIAMEMAVQGTMVIPDAPTRRAVTCELVTKANLEDFARRYAAAAGLDESDLLPIRP